jgi:arylformamidase
MSMEFPNEPGYNLKARHPERTELYADYAERSEALRRGGNWESLRYAAPARCELDWFPAGQPKGAPLLVFIHGGYWRGGDKRGFSFLADGFRRDGVSTALLGYELAPAVPISAIAQQIRWAIRFLMSEQKKLGFDPTRVTLSGHSAGAHLAAMASCYPDEIGVGGAALRVIGASGVYDLTPVMQTSLRDEIGLTSAEAADQSLPNGRSPSAGEYLILVGERETQDFIDQSRDFHRNLTEHGVPSEFQIVPGCMHFDIFEPLADRKNPIHQRVLKTALRP